MSIFSIYDLLRGREERFSHMKKIYNAPILELLDFVPNAPIGNETGFGNPNEGEFNRPSNPWDDGELGWT